jgi:TIR domain-containing protein
MLRRLARWWPRRRTSPRVFLSHAHADKAVAREAWLALGERSVAASIDDLDVHVGDDLRRVLSSQLDRCDTFILFWSRHAPREWVLWELGEAIERRLRIVVAALDESERPEPIRHQVVIDFRESTRLGLLRLVTAVAEPGVDVVTIRGGARLFQPDVDDLKWRLSAPDALARKWRIALSDCGMLDAYAGIFARPPQTPPGWTGTTPQDVRPGYLKEARALLDAGETVATCLVHSLCAREPYREHPEILPLESCRRFAAWLYCCSLQQLSRWLTDSEYEGLEASMRERLERSREVIEAMEEQGIARNNPDPVDVLLGAEAPLHPEHYRLVDLTADDALAHAAGSDYVSIYLPTDVAEKLLDAEWPPTGLRFDARAWAVLFVPQIAVDATLAIAMRGAHADPQWLDRAFTREAYSRVGPH